MDNDSSDLVDEAQEMDFPFAPNDPMLLIAPPLMDIDDEPIWSDVEPKNGNKILFDSAITIEPRQKALFDKAFMEPLPVKEQNEFKQFLKIPNFAHAFGLKPESIGNIIENNSQMAVELLLKLGKSYNIIDYLNVIGKMEITLHTMEVVCHLTNLVDLPREFIHMFTMKCIKSCEKVKEKQVPVRLVHFVCIFLQSLIRSRPLDVNNIRFEIETFCMENSNVHEALVLFRLLRINQNNEPSNFGDKS